MQHPFPYLGFGLGLRVPHYERILAEKPNAIEWFEILTENYLVPGGKPLYYLDQIADRYPTVMHGVSLSLGSTDPLNWDYLKQVRALSHRIQARWISDHLCWTGVQALNMHDLLPLPYTEESLKHVADRIRQIQDFLECPLLIENVSSYVHYTHSTLTEWDFLCALTEESGCYLLLDVNNVYVSAFNHQWDPMTFLKALPRHRIVQFHLAGHCNKGHYIVDTHDAPVIDPVWQLYEEALTLFGPVSTMIERDADIPPLEVLLEELSHAKKIAKRALSLKHPQEISCML